MSLRSFILSLLVLPACQAEPSITNPYMPYSRPPPDATSAEASSIGDELSSADDGGAGSDSAADDAESGPVEGGPPAPDGAVADAAIDGPDGEGGGGPVTIEVEGDGHHGDDQPGRGRTHARVVPDQ
jgi:hypothetical protein